MQLDIFSYNDLLAINRSTIRNNVKSALCETGIIGVRDVPHFQEKSQAYIHVARAFAELDERIKRQYAPSRDNGETEGYELGAEWFQNMNGEWQIDDKKASYYACVPDKPKNKWPQEIELKMPYLELAELIFETGKKVLHLIGINEESGVPHNELEGYGRMLHYHKEKDTTSLNPNWCGAHFDHGVFTGLMPAYYFREGKAIPEPLDAGLYIVPTNGNDFEKVNGADHSILLFQVGEFGQIATHDEIRATRHIVKKAKEQVERFTFALFYSPNDHTVIQSRSVLTKDTRFINNQLSDGRIQYGKWNEASLARYRAV